MTNKIDKMKDGLYKKTNRVAAYDWEHTKFALLLGQYLLLFISYY